MKPYLSLLLLAFVLAGCGGTGLPPNEIPKSQNVDPAPLVAANNAFALDLYSQLRTEPGNLFFSPYSISTALEMVYAGARGETADQMAKVMHLPPVGEKVHAMSATLAARLFGVDPSTATLKIANALWVQQGYPLQESFTQNLLVNYGAPVSPLDFSQSVKAARAINDWTAEQTNGLIKDLIPSGVLSEDTRLVLTNALYWKAGWKTVFERTDTKNEAFYITANETVPVPLMHKFGYDCKLSQNDEVSCAELAYKSSKFAMLVILPNKLDGLTALEQTLTSTKIAEWIAGMQWNMIEVWLPKFRAESRLDLIDNFKAMGMYLPFDPEKADLSGMLTEPTFLYAALHAAMVDVDEKGTTATAATAVGAKSAAPANPPVFRADHPFLFLIRDTDSGEIMFMGRFVKP